MERTVLIDSNVYIGLLRQRKDPLAEMGRRFELTDIACCGVVRAEVLRGIRAPKVLERMKGFFAVTRMIATTETLWNEVTALAWRLDRMGRTLPLSDLVIAACAFRAGAAVLTDDTHFHQIPDLEVIRP